MTCVRTSSGCAPMLATTQHTQEKHAQKDSFHLGNAAAKLAPKPSIQHIAKPVDHSSGAIRLFQEKFHILLRIVSKIPRNFIWDVYSPRQVWVQPSSCENPANSLFCDSVFLCGVSSTDRLALSNVSNTLKNDQSTWTMLSFVSFFL